LKIFVGSLPYEADNETLQNLFSTCGQVLSAAVILDRETYQSKGFGFVEMPDEKQAQLAVAKLDGTRLAGRRLRVTDARPISEERTPVVDDGAQAVQDDPVGDPSVTTIEALLQDLRGHLATGRLSTNALRDVLNDVLRGKPAAALFRATGPKGSPENQRPPSVEFVDDGLIDDLAQDPQRLYQLTPRRFEELCAELFARAGYQHVRLTPASTDGGVDLFAARDDLSGTSLYIVQCKLFRPPHRVGRPDLQKLYGVLHDTRATKAIVATTSWFTAPAVAWQADKPNQLGLADFDAIAAWLEACRQR
jgi:hypothetical protein